MRRISFHRDLLCDVLLDLLHFIHLRVNVAASLSQSSEWLFALRSKPPRASRRTSTYITSHNFLPHLLMFVFRSNPTSKYLILFLSFVSLLSFCFFVVFKRSTAKYLSFKRANNFAFLFFLKHFPPSRRISSWKPSSWKIFEILFHNASVGFCRRRKICNMCRHGGTC